MNNSSTSEVSHPFSGDGFGITLDGGIDRPLYERDKGIFIIGIRGGSNAEKLGSLQAGDKILEVLSSGIT